MENNELTFECLDDKLKNYYSDMVVLKSDLKSVFEGLNMPSYIRDWVLKRYSDVDGEIDFTTLADKLKKIMPSFSEWNYVLDKIMSGMTVKILAKISIRINLKSGGFAFTLPDYGVDETSTYISESVWENVKNAVLSGGERWGVIELCYMKVPVSPTKTEGKICLLGFTDFKPYKIDREYFKTARKYFTTEEWLDIILGAIDYSSEGFENEDQKLAVLKRLLPFVESRLNLIELAPKGTGKSYMFSQISRYGWLVSGGVVSRAKMFYDMQKRREGLVCCYDYVALDEVSSIDFTDVNEMRGAMKGYLESGSFTVGNKYGTGDAGLVLLGNISKDRMNVEENMFLELPEIFNESALIDRFHGFIEGWTIPRMSESRKKVGPALNSEYFASILHELRSDISYPSLINRILVVPSNADTRDVTAVKRLVAGYIKLLFPHWQEPEDVDKEEFIKYCLTPAVHMRGIIRKQLATMDKEYRAEMPEFGVKID